MQYTKRLLVFLLLIYAVGATVLLFNRPQVVDQAQAAQTEDEKVRAAAQPSQLDASVPEDTKAFIELLQDQYQDPMPNQLGLLLQIDAALGEFLTELPGAKRQAMRLLLTEKLQGYNRVKPGTGLAYDHRFATALESHIDALLSPNERQAYCEWHLCMGIRAAVNATNAMQLQYVPTDRQFISNKEVDQIAAKAIETVATSGSPLAQFHVHPLSPTPLFQTKAEFSAFEAQQNALYEQIGRSAATVLSPEKMKAFEDQLALSKATIALVGYTVDLNNWAKDMEQAFKNSE